MKITIISGTYPPMRCGVGDYTELLGRHLAMQGMDVSVITSRQANNNETQNVRVYNIVEQWNRQSIKAIVNQLEKIMPDIILFQWPTAAYGRAIAVNYLPKAIKKHFPHIPLAATLHELRYFKPWTRLRLTWLYQVVDHLVLVDPQDKPWLPMRLKKKNEAFLSIIPIGSNIPQAKDVDLEKLKKALNIEKDDTVVAFFGFANQPKGLDLLVAALSELHHLRFKFLLLSQLNEHNKYQKKILEKIDSGWLRTITINRYNLPANEMAAMLKLSDLAVLPFLDGVSIKRGTLMACLNQHLPIISTFPQNDEYKLFKHNENIWLVPAKKKNILKEAIEFLIKNPLDRRRLAEGTKELVNKFDWSAIAREHIDLFVTKTKSSNGE